MCKSWYAIVLAVKLVSDAESTSTLPAIHTEVGNAGIVGVQGSSYIRWQGSVRLSKKMLVQTIAPADLVP